MISFEEFYGSLNAHEKDLMIAYQELLKNHHFHEILEVGSGWGIFTRACMEFSHAKVTTIDKIGGYGAPLFNKNTAGFESRIERVEGDSQSVLPGWEEKYHDFFDIAFVDADHTLDGASKDLTNAWKLVGPGGVMMVDDVFHKCNWELYDDANTKRQEFNFGVTRALWGFLEAHREEIDGFPMVIPVAHGIVYFRKKS